MNTRNHILVALNLILGVGFGLAQNPPTTEDWQKDALEVLRRTVAEREKAVQTDSQPAPASTRTAVPPTTAAPNQLPTMAEPDFKEMERLYLDGKISAKQFQNFLRTYKGQTTRATTPPSLSTTPPTLAPAPRTTPLTPQEQALELLRQPPPASARTGAVTQPVPEKPATPTSEAGLPAVEKRIDELLRLKEAREQAAKTNAVPAASDATAAPKTKRQRLDDLLKIYIAGSISEAEYNEKRAQILAEK